MASGASRASAARGVLHYCWCHATLPACAAAASRRTHRPMVAMRPGHAGGVLLARARLTGGAARRGGRHAQPPRKHACARVLHARRGRRRRRCPATAAAAAAAAANCRWWRRRSCQRWGRRASGSGRGPRAARGGRVAAAQGERCASTCVCLCRTRGSCFARKVALPPGCLYSFPARKCTRRSPRSRTPHSPSAAAWHAVFAAAPPPPCHGQAAPGHTQAGALAAGWLQSCVSLPTGAMRVLALALHAAMQRTRRPAHPPCAAPASSLACPPGASPPGACPPGATRARSLAHPPILLAPRALPAPARARRLQ